MEVFTNYQHLPLFKMPIALTVGSFDGLHLGHQKIFHTLAQLKQQHHGTTVVLTFSNHPIEVIKSIKVPKITPLEEKLALLKELGVDAVILVEFSEVLQKLPYDTFIQDLHKNLTFNYLVLGKGATLGHNQEGNESRIKALSTFLKFESIYLEKSSYEDTLISSKTIREKLELGDVETAKNLLGRPFAIYAPFHLDTLQETGEHRLKVTFDFQNHCTLPSGYYIVNLKADDFTTLASA
jgi:riboflavin kinase/FMN adenylyltransferase